MNKSLLEIAIRAADEAGSLLIKWYAQKEIQISTKPDHSPVTAADIASSDLLIERLESASGIPVISEERIPSAHESLDRYWLVDPLDGTQEFINRTDEFTVNVALIESGVPALGVIYAPQLQECFFASTGDGAFYRKNSKTSKILGRRLPEMVLARSRHYHTVEVEEFIKRAEIKKVEVIGAALKFGRLALGSVSIYLRYAACSEWDTAAGHCIVESAGGTILDLTTEKRPAYHKPEFKNNPFLACAPGVDSERLLALIREN